MEEDKIIEEIFNTILRNGWGEFSPFDNREFSRAAIGLKSKGYLVTPHINTNIYEVTRIGEEVLQSGGWKSYSLMKAKEKKILEDKQFYEYKISKFKYYTLWPALVLGIIGGIYSIVEMVKSSSENNKPKTEKSAPENGSKKLDTVKKITPVSAEILSVSTTVSK